MKNVIITDNIEEQIFDLVKSENPYMTEWAGYFINNEGGAMLELESKLRTFAAKTCGVYTSPDNTKVLFIKRRKGDVFWLIKVEKSVHDIYMQFAGRKARRKYLEELAQFEKFKQESEKKYCGKIPFIDESSAIRKMREIERISDRKKIPKRCYKCEICGLYHLTSQSKVRENPLNPGGINRS